MTLDSVTIDGIDDVVDVMCDAFADYPVMRYVVGTDPARSDERLRALIGFFVFRRARQGAPMLLVRDAGGVAMGAAVLTLPREPEMPPDVAIRRDELWRVLGADAHARYETYANACKAFAIAEPHHHLNMIGVCRAQAGRGVGRVLLDAVRGLSVADPGSAGVSLTTERARNVELYEHVGYVVTGHVRIADDLETWGMYMSTGRHPDAD